MSVDLIIPIYVDTNSLLDLLASIEDGFSIVEKVTTQNTSNRGIEREVKADTGTEFGIPNVLSLLKLTIGYGAKWGNSTEDRTENEAEKYHTYGSLFHRLREYLENQSLIKKIHDEEDSWDSIQPSDFIEIRGVFRPNPLTNSLGIVNRLLGISELLSGGQVTHTQKPKGKLTAEQRQKFEEQKQQAEKAKSQAAQIDQFRKFLTGIIDDIEEENVRSFVIDSADTQKFTAVALLFLEYLRDKTMTELSNKEYHMLGKVVRKLEEDSEEPIDLLLGTALGGIGEDTVEQLVNVFADTPGMNLPTIQTKITGPALEIVPIAIFV